MHSGRVVQHLELGLVGSRSNVQHVSMGLELMAILISLSTHEQMKSI